MKGTYLCQRYHKTVLLKELCQEVERRRHCISLIPTKPHSTQSYSFFLDLMATKGAKKCFVVPKSSKKTVRQKNNQAFSAKQIDGRQNY